MPQTPLTDIIAAVVGPVALISSTSIMMSGLTAKYSGLAAQMRALTHEYRDTATTPDRRATLKLQLCYFRRRLGAMWFISVCLCLALISFLATVLSVYLSENAVRVGPIAMYSMAFGLVLIGVALTAELYETVLARMTVTEELCDILDEK